MKWGMEISSSPSSNISNSSWVIEESRNTKWTQAENKQFEDALARFDMDTPDKWQKVAAMVPGKTIADVMKQYKELEDDVSSIEAGLVPIPGYNTSPFTLEWRNRLGFDGFRPSSGTGADGKRSAAAGGRPSEQERKKGVPWTEEEHRLFLLGLKKYGKGDWRNISRNFVISRTPTQVASHAQKYFIRQLSGGKDKRRASIHDITTVNVDEHLLVDAKHSPLQDQHSATTHPHHPLSFQWNSDATCFNQGNINMFGSRFGEDAYEQKIQVVQPIGVDGVHESYDGPQRTGFQMQIQVVQPIGVDGVHESYDGPQRTEFQMHSGIQYRHL